MYVVYINLLYFLSIFLFTYNKNLLSQKIVVFILILCCTCVVHVASLTVDNTVSRIPTPVRCSSTGESYVLMTPQMDINERLLSYDNLSAFH